MIREQRLGDILDAMPDRSVAVVGDFCLDRYLDIDPEIEDRSRETGRTVHQVTDVRTYPGGGANVVNNLAGLGVGKVVPVGFVGADPAGLELRKSFQTLEVPMDFLRRWPDRPTPVYLKPVIVRDGRPAEELDRFDIFPRSPLSDEQQDQVVEDLRRAFVQADALVVADYAERGKHGVVTARVRRELADLARTEPSKAVIADSRLYVDKFRRMIVKPNAEEAMACLAKEPGAEPTMVRLIEIGRRTAERNQRPLAITLGPGGVLLCAADRARKIPAYPVDEGGETNPVGAGDTTLAALAASLAAGATLEEAAVLAVIAASLTVEQAGHCGAPSANRLRRRFREYAERHPDVVGG